MRNSRAYQPTSLPEQFTIVGATRLGAAVRWVFAEQASKVRKTKWHLGGRRTDRVLSLPRMLFLIRFYRGVFEKCFLFFLRDPYQGRTTELYHTILPNQGDNGWVCMGGNQFLCCGASSERRKRSATVAHSRSGLARLSSPLAPPAF